MEKQDKGKFNRREFIAATAAIGVATVIPHSALGKGFTLPGNNISTVSLNEKFCGCIYG